MRALFLILLLFPFTLLAEYRVFIIHINNQTNKTQRQVRTTLDPEQFKQIFPLNNTELISYVETWLCKGRTDFFKSHCKQPQNISTKVD